MRNTLKEIMVNNHLGNILFSNNPATCVSSISSSMVIAETLDMPINSNQHYIVESLVLNKFIFCICHLIAAWRPGKSQLVLKQDSCS